MDNIEDYLLIGDLHSAALVSKSASIDWLCLPHFDSPSIFGKLLDKNAGHFSVEKEKPLRSNYLRKTAIVRHEFDTFDLHDFMVPAPTNHCDVHFLVRKIVGKKGTSEIVFSFLPKENYGEEEFEQDEDLMHMLPKTIENTDNEPGIILKTGNHFIVLYVPKSAKIVFENGQYRIYLEVNEGESKSLILAYATYMDSGSFSHDNLEKETLKFWEEWVGKGTFFDYQKDQLIRSAITLKLMQFYPTGAIVAAPTTSLPESLGNVRNWDYRYVWIRDATFTLYALFVLGYTEEAERFFAFCQKTVESTSNDTFGISLMYTIEGKEVPQEKILDFLSGYKNSKPVRIGNEASQQFQLDVYGSLIDTYYFVSKKMNEVHEVHRKFILELAAKIEEMWKIKDSGIWEVRSGSQHFTYSKVMSWVGIDRVLKMKKLLRLSDEQIYHFEKLEKEINQWIWDNCFDSHNSTFQQYAGAPLQDATNFLFVLLHFLDKHDDITKVIIKKTYEELSAGGAFIYRYLGPDGLPRGEGAFLLCTFWAVSALAIVEDVERAEKLFNMVEKHMKPHGLLAEEIDSNTGEFLGNYPQAFSHMGFIMACFYIHKYKNRLSQ